MRLILAALSLAATFAVAEQVPKTCPPGMDEDEFAFLSTEGGTAYKPGTGYGAFLFLNSQSRVPRSELELVRPAIATEIDVEVKISEKRLQAEIVTELVDRPGEPGLAIYPEEKRATVNVAALLKDNPSAKLLASRTRKEMLRAFSYLTGITGGGTSGHLMDIMTDMKRLDAAPEMVPGELVLRFDDFIVRSGVKPYERYTYKQACEEGWAAKPTNMWQRAIWEKVQNKKADKADPTNRWKRDFPDKEKSNTK